MLKRSTHSLRRPARGRGARNRPPASSQTAAPYVDALVAYARRHPTRYVVPGHKGGYGADPALRELLGPLALEYDVTHGLPEIDAGARPAPLEQAERLAAEAHGAARTWFLTNGATQGNHALALAYAATGTTVALERNVHASVLDGLVLSGGTPVDVMPSYDPALGVPGVVTPGRLATALRARPEISAVFITSPSYFGMAAHVAACAAVAHDHGAAAIVDQSWGAHLGFHPDLPRSALGAGADAVLTSTHKLAGSLGQSAMVHLARDSRLPREPLERAVRLLRSTSVSSLLMLSLDVARRRLALEGEQLLSGTLATARWLRRAIDAIPGCAVADFTSIEGVAATDPLKLFVDVRGTGASGHAVADRLRGEHAVSVELTTETGLLLLLGIEEPLAPAERFVAALRAVVGERRLGEAVPPPRPGAPPPPGERVLTPREAFLAPLRRLGAADAVGRVCAELVAGYPPGIPTLVPGERVTSAALEHLAALRDAGVRLHGASDPALATLLVVDPAEGA